jgi:hypothetical protein
MTALRRALVVGTLLTGSAFVYACVGDSPAVSGGPTEDGGGADAPGVVNPTNDGGGGGGDDAGNGAACDGGTICNGACIDTSGDQANCGRCEHSCGAGKCTAGVCQAVLIAGDADGGANITSLTTDQSDDNPQGLAQRVFWSVTGAGGGVFQDNVTGGNTLTLTSTAPASRTNVVVNQSNVYWFSQNFGGSPQPVLKAQVNTANTPASVGVMNCPFIQSILFDPASQNVIGSYQVNATTHGVFKCGPGGGVACTSMITFAGVPSGNVATEGTNVFYCDSDNGLIQKTTLTGGSSGTFISGQVAPNLLRVDGANLYWNNSGNKTIQRAPVAGAAAGKQVTSTTNAVDGLAADAVNAYWTESATGTLSYTPITGAGAKTPYVTLGASSVPMRLARDTGFLYFSHKGGIYRVALP